MKRSEPTSERTEAETALRVAKEYWLRTIQPHIAERKLREVEFLVAQDAHSRVHAAQEQARKWNRTTAGQECPIDVGLIRQKFPEPEALFADKTLKPESLAAIAAPLMTKSKVRLTPAEAVRNAHELLMAAERYIGTLPEQKTGEAEFTKSFALGSSAVSFTTILASNKKDSGQLPFLPTVQRKRHGGKLSLNALRIAVKRFFEAEKENRLRITEARWNILSEEDDRHFKSGLILALGSGERPTRQEWQNLPLEAMKDCLENNRISLNDLCELRWERFKTYWQNQERRVLNRKPRKSK